MLATKGSPPPKGGTFAYLPFYVVELLIHLLRWKQLVGIENISCCLEFLICRSVVRVLLGRVLH